MRCLSCLALIMATLFTLSAQAKEEFSSDNVTFIFVATSVSKQEFLFLSASSDVISWSFYEGNKEITTKKFDPETFLRTTGEVPGNPKNLKKAFSVISNPEQPRKLPVKQEESEDDYISPYNFSMILVDATGVKACSLSHEQQVKLSHCEELKSVFDATRHKVTMHKMMMMPDLLNAGMPMQRDVTKSKKRILSIPVHVQHLSGDPKAEEQAPKPEKK